jgi:release factor glutamine methyltransferase
MNERFATVAEAMRQARALGVDRLDAQLLLAQVLARPRSWVVAHDDAPLGEAQQSHLGAWFARRAGGEPLAYLLGEQEFHGLMLHVGPGVLVPRPDTEVLVDWAIELLTGAWPETTHAHVADLGTGSGAIALAVKHARPGATVTATEVSPVALDTARENVQRLRLDVELLPGSWWQPLEGRRFHLVLSNPPYITGADPHLDALRHEPTLALTPGGDGLGALRRIVEGARAHLEAGGWLLLEHGYDQADAVAGLLRDHGFEDVQTRRDLGGQPRCTGGHR